MRRSLPTQQKVRVSLMPVTMVDAAAGVGLSRFFASERVDLAALRPECAVYLVGDGLHDVGPDVALAGLDVDFGRHARLQAARIPEAGRLVVKCRARHEIRDLALRVLDE